MHNPRNFILSDALLVPTKLILLLYHFISVLYIK